MAQAKQKTERAPLSDHLQRGLREGALFLSLFLAAYILVALFTYAPSDPGWSQSGHTGHVANMGGLAGAWFADVVLALFGYLAYLIPAMLAYAGWLIFRQLPLHQEEWRGLSLRGIGFVFTLGASCGLASLYDHYAASQLPQNVTAGGILGDLVKNGMTYAFNQLGATLLLLALFFSGFTLFTNLSWLKLMDLVGGITLNGIGWLHARMISLRALIRDRRDRPELPEEIARENLKQQKEKIVKRPPPRIEPVIKEPTISTSDDFFRKSILSSKVY